MSLVHRLLSAGLLACSTASPATDCMPTPHRTTGTHYEPVTEKRGNVGSGVAVRGRILAAPDCTPIAGARVAHWQAGEDGFYSDRLRAYLLSDANGNYRFETEWPALPTPHIHFIVTADGYERLETQWIGNERTGLVEFNMVLKPVE